MGMAPDFSGPFIFGKSTNSGEPVRLAACSYDVTSLHTNDQGAARHGQIE